MAIPFSPGTITPTPTQPYLIDPNDCIGDSVVILNSNTNYLATNIANLATNINNKFVETGRQIQTVHYTTNTVATYLQKNALVPVSFLTIPITTKVANSKILVQYVISVSTYVGFFGLQRDGTGIGGFTINDPGRNYGTINNVHSMMYLGESSGVDLTSFPLAYLDSPSKPAGTTINYTPTVGSTWFKSTGTPGKDYKAYPETAYNVFINRRGSADDMYATSTITVTELAP